ncbi:MAG: glycoside hydrolase family 5 protein [Balneolaceae bacterium]|nr:glycoside hydrolase family 5 protein [Balneolaceae bacterium]
MKSYSLLLSILFFFNTIACSQSGTAPTMKDDSPEIYNTTDPFKINESLGTGVNLGNALEAPSEGEWGMVIREEYLQLIADAGFQSVRIPIRWNAHAGYSSPYKIDEAFFERVDEVIGWGFNNNLKVIINIHHYNELMESPQNHKERFLALWTQIAEHFQDYPNDLVFEILNESHANLTSAFWNNYLELAINTIRKTNKERILMIGTAPWGGFDGIQTLDLPENDQQLIVTVHYYNPFQFTHQGASWAGEESDNWLGTTWTGTPQEKTAVDDDFNRVEQWAAENNRPIHIGEFGAYEAAPLKSRIHWTAYIRSSAEQRDFSWAYWEFGAGFGIYDRSNNQWREGLLKALLPNTNVVE